MLAAVSYWRARRSSSSRSFPTGRKFARTRMAAASRARRSLSAKIDDGLRFIGPDDRPRTDHSAHYATETLLCLGFHRYSQGHARSANQAATYGERVQNPLGRHPLRIRRKTQSGSTTSALFKSRAARKCRRRSRRATSSSSGAKRPTADPPPGRMSFHADPAPSAGGSGKGAGFFKGRLERARHRSRRKIVVRSVKYICLPWFFIPLTLEFL
jgi:hypothetical protein